METIKSVKLRFNGRNSYGEGLKVRIGVSVGCELTSYGVIEKGGKRRCIMNLGIGCLVNEVHDLTLVAYGKNNTKDITNILRVDWFKLIPY